MTQDQAKVVFLSENILKLFGLVSDESKCKWCGQAIWWMKHKNGKPVAYTHEALNHFIDCPNAKEIRDAYKPKAHTEAV